MEITALRYNRPDEVRSSLERMKFWGWRVVSYGFETHSGQQWFVIYFNEG